MSIYKRLLSSKNHWLLILIVVIFLSIIVFTFGTYIYNYGLKNMYNSYFNRYDVTGTVLTIGGRYSDDKSQLYYKPSFKLRTVDSKEVYVNCNDTRCTLVSVGESVRLSCYTELQRQGADEIECRWGR